MDIGAKRERAGFGLNGFCDLRRANVHYAVVLSSFFKSRIYG